MQQLQKLKKQIMIDCIVCVGALVCALKYFYFLYLRINEHIKIQQENQMAARARRSCRAESINYAEEDDDPVPLLDDVSSSEEKSSDDEDVFSGDETDDDENVLLAD